VRYAIRYTRDAISDLKSLRAHDRAAVRDAVERFLMIAPEKAGKRRIKRLRGLSKPQYRL